MKRIIVLLFALIFLVFCNTQTEYQVLEDEEFGIEEEAEADEGEWRYILNTNTKKIHYPFCYSAERIKDENLDYFSGNVEALLDEGYTVCKNCFY